MKIVRLTEDCEGRKQGAVLRVSDERAQTLVGSGVAVYDDQDAQGISDAGGAPVNHPAERSVE